MVMLTSDSLDFPTEDVHEDLGGGQYPHLVSPESRVLIQDQGRVQEISQAVKRK